MSQDKAAQLKQAAAEDGVHVTPQGTSDEILTVRSVNPGGIGISAFSAAYLGLIPVTSWLAKTGALSTVVDGVARLIPGYAPSSGRVIPALSALYIFWTFGASGAVSAAGQAMAREAGLDNEHPRKHIGKLEGLPLRMRSAHYGLLENFPSFALAAALAQILTPRDTVVINLLGYHVIAKLFIYYPAYLLNLAPLRTLAHVSSIAALINVCWRLAAGST